MASTTFRSNADAARPVNVALLGNEDAAGSIEFPTPLEALDADTSAYSESRLRQWRALPEHYILGIRERQTDAGERLSGLVLCHADGEDFIADEFMLNTLALGRAVEHEIVRTLGQLAVASGCGAVVLRYAKVDGDGAVARFYRSLGVAVETLPTGEQEVAFAWQAVDWLLERAVQLQQYLLPWGDSHEEAQPVEAPRF